MDLGINIGIKSYNILFYLYNNSEFETISKLVRISEIIYELFQVLY